MKPAGTVRLLLACLAGLGALATLAYLAPGLPETVVLLGAAVAALALPFVLLPRPGTEAGIVAAWFVSGVLGVYFFGIFVALTGLVGALVLAARALLLDREARRT